MEATRKKAGRRELWLIGILTLVAVVLGATLLIGNNEDETSDAATPPTASEMGPAGDHSRRINGDPLAVGAVDAPVVLVEYSDYRCPFCAKFSRDTEPALIEKYVNAGILRIEWRDLPIFGEQSTSAARAGRAAAAQGKFWEYNAALYSQAPDRGHPDLTNVALNDIAVKAGVPDLERFEVEATSSKFDESISQDMYEARMTGLSSTPSFIVNGTPVLGAQPLKIFERVIDRAAGL